MLQGVGYVIVFVRDMRRSVEFYRDTLGLPMGMESEHWTEFATGGTKIALHLAEHLGPAPALAKDPGEAKSCAVEIVFQCDDPLAMRAELVKRKVNVAPAKLVHEAGPMVGVSCLFQDPDANVLSVYGLVPKSAWK